MTAPFPGYATHHVHWPLTAGEPVIGEMLCDNPTGSTCRLVCAQECGAEQWPCGDPPHPMVDGGKCQVVLSADIGEVTNCYGGPDTEVRDGEVNVWWDPDGFYAWAYVGGEA